MTETYAERETRLAPLNTELKRLNEAVQEAIRLRQVWMDAHMDDYAELHVGDDIYDLNSGRKLGVVTELYRPTWGSPGPRETESMRVYYKYKTGEHGGAIFIDNTSRQMDLYAGTHEEAVTMQESRLRAVKAGYSGGLSGW